MHTDEYIDLTKDQWIEVIEKASSSEISMFILRSWANSQTVSWGSINAFNGKIVESDDDRKFASTRIGNITTWIRQVTSRNNGSCYIWNKDSGSWSIGYYQTYNLREALGVNGEL